MVQRGLLQLGKSRWTGVRALIESAGIAGLSFSGLGLFYGTEESSEGVRASAEDRQPDYSQYRAQASS